MSIEGESLPRDYYYDAFGVKPNHPPTPAKGERMPDTKEHWEKFTAMQDELIMEQKAEISRLKHSINNLRQSLIAKYNTPND